MRVGTAGWLVAMAAAVLAMFASPASAQAPVAVRVISFGGGFNLPVWVGQSRGFFPWGGFNTDSRKVVSGGMWVNLSFADAGNSFGASLSPYVNFRFSTRLGGSLGMPSMFDLGMNAIQMLQYELGNHRAIAADVIINPDLAEFTWIEFYRAAEIVERGAEAAERVLPQLRRLLAERLATRGYGTTATRSGGGTPAILFGRRSEIVPCGTTGSPPGVGA